MNEIKIFMFDAYGTIFDVNAACNELSIEIGKKWEELSFLWRLKQLEYTWLRNSMNEYKDFWGITEDSLDYAMNKVNINNKDMRKKLLDLYFRLKAYPEVKEVLMKLKHKNIKTGILSNGTDAMLNEAVKNAKIDKLIDIIISVEECKIYKPSSKVYDMVERKTNFKKNEVMFCSSNAWDMHAAANYGFKSIWVNRFNQKLEKIPGIPHKIVKKLDDIANYINNKNIY